MNPIFSSDTTSILDDPYQKELQLDLWQYERKKTAQALFTVAGVLLLGNFIAYASADALRTEYLLDVLLFPVLLFGLGLFARLQPMVAMIGGIVVLLVITVLGWLAAGAVSLISGWLFKVIALYFVIKGVRHASEAEKARKQLQLLG